MVKAQAIICIIVAAASLLTSYFLNNRNVRLANIASTIAAIPTLFALSLELLDIPYSYLVAQSVRNPLPVIGVLVVVSVLPTITGLVVDLPIALLGYKKRMAKKGTAIRLSGLSHEDICNICQYGDTEIEQFTYEEGDKFRVIETHGRFNMHTKFMLVSLLNNMFGMTCVASLLIMAHSISGLADYIQYDAAVVVDFFELVISVAVFLAFLHVNGQQTMALPAEKTAFTENPDNYLLNRAHSLFNTIHLVCTLTFGPTILIWVLVFSIRHFQSIELPGAILILVVFGIAFLWNTTHVSKDTNAANLTTSNWGNGPWVVIVVTVLTIVPFRFGAVHVGVIVELVAFAALWFFDRPQKRSLGLKDFMVVILALGVLVSVIMMLFGR